MSVKSAFKNGFLTNIIKKMYQENQRDDIKRQFSKPLSTDKINCSICGGNYRRSGKQQHEKSKKHNIVLNKKIDEIHDLIVKKRTLEKKK